MDEPIPAERSWFAPSTVDAVIAVALASAALVELLASYGGPAGAELAIGAMATIPLAWRRRLPFVVVGLVVVSLSLLTLQGESSFTVAQLLGLMLASYTMGSELEAIPAVVGLLVLVAASLANSAAARSTESGDYVFPVILLGFPWLAGLGIRKWQLRALELRDLAAALAAERETHAELVIAAERGRIARDLHDSLAQSLNAVVVHAEVAEAASGLDAATVAKSVRRIQEIGRASLAETRAMVGAMRGEEVGAQPRLDQLDQLADHYRQAGLVVRIEQSGVKAGLSSSTEATIYRIVQESLTNVLRHSSSRHAWVRVELGPRVRVQVRDDGASRPSEGRTGFGLVGMRERVALLGGELVAEGRVDGFVVEARLPGGPA